MAARPIILYEGPEDRAFLEELLKVLALNGQFDFHQDCGGKGKFGIILKALVAESANRTYEQRKAVILVADNDGDPKNAFKDVQAQIRAAGFKPPENPRQTAAAPELPPVSVLMIPWDDDPGCLEMLCLSAANPNYQKQLECAEALVQCAGAQGWGIAKQSKLKMRGFLSAVCKSDPNTGLRYAWSTDGGRPGDIFPLNNMIVYGQIADFLKSFMI